MKKIRLLPALLALLLILGLSACGAPAPEPSLPVNEPAVSAAAPVSSFEPSPAPSQSVVSSDTSEPAESAPEPESAAPRADSPAEDEPPALDENGSYTTKEDVALYIHLFGKLPPNFITKGEAEKLGWSGGGLEKYAPGKCIGGNRFGNYEGLLPKAEGRSYTECDIDTLGASKRGAKRIVFSNDGLIYYTGDHYQSFELLYGEE